MIKKKGFTYLELLIIIATLILLILVATWSVIGLRQKARDTKRLNDIYNLKSIMREIYLTDQTYENLCQGESQGKIVSQCLAEYDPKIFEDYYSSLVFLNDPSQDERACDQTCFEAPCNYAFGQVTDETFEIIFYLEKGVSGFEAGCHTLTQLNIQ